MRILIAGIMIAPLLLIATGPTRADIFRPRIPDPEQCQIWDCEGDIICSCCMRSKGCWICSAGPGGTIDMDDCHFDKKMSLKHPTSPGGGILDPGGGFNPNGPGPRGTAPPAPPTGGNILR